MASLQQSLGSLPHRAQAAFGAACIERVLSVYRRTFDGGKPGSGPKQAAELAWQFASGSRIPAERIAEVAAAVDASYPEPDLGGGPDWAVCSASVGLVETLADASGKSIKHTAEYELYALQLLDGEGQKEEALWQQALFERIRALGDGPIDRAQLETLIAQPSEWLARFEAE